MIEKFTFVELMNACESCDAGVEQLQKALNCQFDDNFLTTVLTNITDVMALSFFSDEDRDYVDTHQPGWLHERNEDYLLSSVDTVYDMIFHYMFNCKYGTIERHCKEFMKVTQKDGTEVEYTCFDAEQLYDAIVAYLNRTDELCITIKCSSRL